MKNNTFFLKKIEIIAVTVAFIVTVSPSSASADTIAELQAQIQALLAQVVALQAQLGTQTTSNSGTNSSIAAPSAACIVLTNNLYVDIDDSESDGEVSQLQTFLAQDFSVYPEARVTGYFGPATERAVKRWQTGNGVVSRGTPDTTGYGAVGPKTRAALARGCGVAIRSQIIPESNVKPVVIPETVVFVPPQPSTAPNLSVSSVYAGTVNVNYANLPVNSQLVFVNATTNERFGPQSTMVSGGGSGSVSISEHPDMAQTLYFLRAQNYSTGAVIAESSAFLLGSKQTGVVACSLTADKASYKFGETITFSWKSQNATRAEWIDDTDKDNIPLPIGIPGLSGSTIVSANVLGNPYLVLRVYGPSGTATCTKSVPVNENASQIPLTRKFSASPVSGSAPLAVTFSIQNAEGSFVDFGDGSAPMLCTDKGGDSCSSTGVPHTYTSSGTRTAQLKQSAYRCYDTLELRGCRYEYDPAGATIGTATIIVSGQSTNTITVTAPNGGEQWEIGTLNTVTWTPYQYNPDVNPSKDVTAYLERKCVTSDTDIQCEKDGYKTLGRVEESGKASIHWTTGQLTAATQSNLYAAPGSDYYIRVVNNVTGSWDRSDAPFTLLPRPITLLVNGSDKYVAINDVAQPITISWTTSYNLYNCQLTGINEVSFSTIQPSTGSVTGHITYQNVSGGISYGVVLQCVRNVNGVPTQVSANAPFYVNYIPSPASLQITSPNGGEQQNPQNSLNTTFKHSGIKSYSIALYRNDQWYAWIAKDQPIMDSYDILAFFTPADLFAGLGTGDNAGAIFKIYITGQKSDGTGYVDDKSDAPFSFVSPVPTGSYLAYMNGYLKATSENITKADALANCKLNAANNPGWLHHCRWNNEIIYSDTQVTLQYPNGGQSFIAGSGNSVTVTWNAIGVPGGSTICTLFMPEGWDGGGFAFPGSSSCSNATSGAGAHTGTLIRNSGYDLAPGTYRAVVRIIGPSDGGKDGQILAKDESDSTFTLTGSSASASVNSSNLANVLTAMESILRSIISKLSSP
ncbi:peptidoglycan-binding protein [Candidatus Kaiserbacteria bacterium]|nr:peptidoglycan-binding protein [Candidatus Kaiserbacteria bacterium]